MFYKLIRTRSVMRYKRSYLSVISVFVITMTLISMINGYRDSLISYDTEVLLPKLYANGDVYIRDIPREYVPLFEAVSGCDIRYANGMLSFYAYSDDERTALFETVKAVFDANRLAAKGLVINRVNAIVDPMPTIYTTSMILGVVVLISSVVMALIYSDHIRLQRGELETLLAVGATKKQLRKLFFGECSIMYLIAAFIGTPIGSLIIFIVSHLYELANISHTNLVYPIFKIYPITIPLILAIGFIGTLIAYGLARLTINATLPCDTGSVDFSGDFRRTGKVMKKKRFVRFYGFAMFRRSKFINRVCIGITVLAMFALEFILAAFTLVSDLDDSGLLFGILTFYTVIAAAVFIYALITLAIFIGRHIDAGHDSIRTLLDLGAVREQMRRAYLADTTLRAGTSVILGYGIGYLLIELLNRFRFFHSGGYLPIRPTPLFILINLFLGALVFALYMLAASHYFNKICPKENENADTVC